MVLESASPITDINKNKEETKVENDSSSKTECSKVIDFIVLVSYHDKFPGLSLVQEKWLSTYRNTISK